MGLMNNIRMFGSFCKKIIEFITIILYEKEKKKC